MSDSSPETLSPKQIVSLAREEFIEALSFNLNVPAAYAAVFSLKKKLRKDFSEEFKKEVNLFLLEANEILQVFPVEVEDVQPIPGYVIKLADDRLKARQVKNWVEADQLRSYIEEAGYNVKDTPESYIVTRKATFLTF